jgi:hypothetical protein
MQHFKKTIATLLVATCLTGAATAHDGRRFDVQVHDSQLAARGYISGNNPTDDGNGIVRDYYNAIHAHWDNIGGLLSRATLPGFDINDTPELLGDELWLEITGVKKWSDAPFADFAHTHGVHDGHSQPQAAMHHGGHASPDFVLLSANESVQVGFNGTPLSPNTPLQLDASIGASAHYDLTFDYYSGDPLFASVAPEDALYLVEMQLSTSDTSILPSETIYTILSPSGMTVPGSHGLSLATEIALGTPVPEPASLFVLGVLPALLCRRRS